MKKTIYLVLIMSACMALAGCGAGGSESRSMNSQPDVKDVIEQEMEKATAEQAVAEPVTEQTVTEPAAEQAATEPAAVQDAGSVPIERRNGVNDNAPVPQEDPGEEGAALSNTEGIDVDLTILSSTMIYAQVFSMMTAPQDFIGKTVRMQGAFSYFKDENIGNEYFACIVKDATECCAQGIEFILDGEHTYPEDYPEIGAEVTVTGVFDTYMEGEYTYVTLRNASFS